MLRPRLTPVHIPVEGAAAMTDTHDDDDLPEGHEDDDEAGED
jgi:hypothetical protein